MKSLLAMGLLAACGAGPSAARAGDGEAVFLQNCLMCHQSGGVGLAGQFPRLAGRVSFIGSKPAGRAYLADVSWPDLPDELAWQSEPRFAHRCGRDIEGLRSVVGLGIATVSRPPRSRSRPLALLRHFRRRGLGDGSLAS